MKKPFIILTLTIIVIAVISYMIHKIYRYQSNISKTMISSTNGIDTSQTQDFVIMPWLSKQTIIDIATQYAPIRWISKDAVFWPINLEDIYSEYGYAKIGDNNYLVLKDPLKTPSEKRPWFVGRNPSVSGYKQANCYVYVIPHTLGYQMVFHSYFAYNWGKEVQGVEIGNHLGDNSIYWVIFNKQNAPLRFGFQYHSTMKEYNWSGHDFYNNYITHKKFNPIREGKHAMVWTATHGNESYLHGDGRYTYKVIGGIVPLVDEMSSGYRIDTWKKLCIITTDNLWGISNTAFDQNGNNISLNTIYPELTNWASQLDYVGSPEMGVYDFGKLGKFKLFTGYNRMVKNYFIEQVVTQNLVPDIQPAHYQSKAVGTNIAHIEDYMGIETDVMQRAPMTIGNTILNDVDEHVYDGHHYERVKVRFNPHVRVYTTYNNP